MSSTFLTAEFLGFRRRVARCVCISGFSGYENSLPLSIGHAMLPDRAFFFQLAEAAKAETLPRFRAGIDVVNKEAVGFDPVTEGDRAAEAAIRALIEAKFPDHGILGEEYGNVGL